MDRDIEIILWDYIKKNFLPHQGSNLSMEYDDSSNLFDMAILDSVGLITCIVFIEERFDLKIPDEDLLPENFSTIHNIADYIRSKVKDQLTVYEDEQKGYI